jgi:hypothetical protein
MGNKKLPRDLSGGMLPANQAGLEKGGDKRPSRKLQASGKVVDGYTDDSH